MRGRQPRGGFPALRAREAEAAPGHVRLCPANEPAAKGTETRSRETCPVLLAEQRKAARMSEVSGEDRVPHLSGGFGFVYALHLVSVMPNAGADVDFKGYSDLPTACATSPPQVESGRIQVPTGPGVGVDIDPELATWGDNDVSETSDGALHNDALRHHFHEHRVTRTTRQRPPWRDRNGQGRGWTVLLRLRSRVCTRCPSTKTLAVAYRYFVASRLTRRKVSK